MIVDASVAVKWFSNEIYSDFAIQLASTEEKLVASDLLSLEVYSTLCKKSRMGVITDTEAAFLCADWQNILQGRLSFHRRLADYLEDAQKLARTYRHPVADCVYISIAASMNMPLATFDREQAAIAQKLSIPLHFSSIWN
jgi:predicted nucleic acid-binding protein